MSWEEYAAFNVIKKRLAPKAVTTLGSCMLNKTLGPSETGIDGTSHSECQRRLSYSSRSENRDSHGYGRGQCHHRIVEFWLTAIEYFWGAGNQR
jgi:hypothetical protein